MKIISFLLDDQTSCSALGHCSGLLVRIKISLLLQTVVRNWVPTVLSWKEINLILLREMQHLALPVPNRVSCTFSQKCWWSQWMPDIEFISCSPPPPNNCILCLLIASDLSRCCAKPRASFTVFHPLLPCSGWALFYRWRKGASERLRDLAGVPKPGRDRTEFTLLERFYGWQFSSACGARCSRTASKPQENGTYRTWNWGGTDTRPPHGPGLLICEGIRTA